jgi:ABC-type nickel/cobalt efflux system permease component RcnA
MTPDQTWHITAATQDRLNIIAAAVCILIVVGFITLWRDWRKSWDAEDFAAGYYLDRDQHATADRTAMLKARAR